MVGRDFITEQPYPFISGIEECTDIPLDEHFPLPCTTCDTGAPTELCNYKTEVCIKLSDSHISIINMNGTLLNQISLDDRCTPRYLQKLKSLSSDHYALVCKEASYYHFRVTATRSIVDATFIAGQGTDGILVESVRTEFGQRRISLHHLELDTGVIYPYNVFHGTHESSIYPDYSCIEDSISLHPLLTLNGRFIISCSTASTSERVYFLHSVDYYDGDPLPLSLCGDPLPSPRGHTFTVACEATLKIYMKNDTAQYHSKTFSSKIVSHSYLNSATVIVNTGNQQHIVNLDLYVATGGIEGVLTVDDTTNCSYVQKLITREIYATACRDATMYDVRLVNRTNGQKLAPVENLTRKPLDVYFAPSPPPTPGPPSSPPNTMTTLTLTTRPPPTTSTKSMIDEKTSTDDSPSVETLASSKASSSTRVEVFIPTLLVMAAFISI